MLARLDASDVVVYIACNALLPGPRPGFGAQLQFVSKAGGIRYALARLNCRLRPDQQIPLLGHELRHAVEIADAASIVDAASFARYFARSGFETSHDAQPATYETDAAQLAQAAIRRDLLGAVVHAHGAAQEN